MSWFVRFSRFASVHMVRSQDLKFSCGMSSIVMTNFKMKKGLMFAGMSAGAQISAVPLPGAQYLGSTLSQASIGYAIKTEDEVYKIIAGISGSANDFDKGGVSMGLYPQALAQLGLGQWECVNVGEGSVMQAAIDSNKAGAPIIVNNHWDAGGDHAMVIDETHSFLGSTYLCICDPWDGELRVVSAAAGSAVRYDGSDTPISVTFGGSRREYAKGNNKGKLDGWIVRRK